MLEAMLPHLPNPCLEVPLSVRWAQNLARHMELTVVEALGVRCPGWHLFHSPSLPFPHCAEKSQRPAMLVEAGRTQRPAMLVEAGRTQRPHRHVLVVPPSVWSAVPISVMEEQIPWTCCAVCHPPVEMMWMRPLVEVVEEVLAVEWSF